MCGPQLCCLEPEFGPTSVPPVRGSRCSLPVFFIDLLSKPGQFVFDPFGGTGTTAFAAEHWGGAWLVTEIDPEYAAVCATV